VVDARDFFMLKSGPHQLEFGHVCENPHDWEQRYEKKDLAKHRHQGQVVATGLYCSQALSVSLFSLHSGRFSLASVSTGCSNKC
jgi:hypothetical protein